MLIYAIDHKLYTNYTHVNIDGKPRISLIFLLNKYVGTYCIVYKLN